MYLFSLPGENAGDIGNGFHKKSRREKAGKETQKLRFSDSARSVAHDMNNLLTVINGYLELIKADTEPGSEHSLHLIDAQAVVDRAIKLNGKLLRKNEEDLDYYFDIKDVIVPLVKGLLRITNIQCEFSANPDLWHLNIDKLIIERILQNILTNSIQAMPDGGKIYVSVTNVYHGDTECSVLKDQRYIKLIIKDEGKGIPKHYLSSIFVPFFSTKDIGNGLGLAITRDLIHACDGHLEVASEEEEGTVFTIYLPANN